MNFLVEYYLKFDNFIIIFLDNLKNLLLITLNLKLECPSALLNWANFLQEWIYKNFINTVPSYFSQNLIKQIEKLIRIHMILLHFINL